MLTQAPKISIIVGVLNMRCYLAATLESVISQNYPNHELIIIDGGSTDGTLEIIQAYEHRLAYWKSEPDQGHSDACNKAIAVATGDFILLLNADDVLAEGLFHKMAGLYQQQPLAQVITCGIRISEKYLEKDHIIKEVIDPNKLQITLENILFNLPVINARFFRRDIFQRFGSFRATHADGSYNLSNDREFLIKLALADVQSLIIPEPLYHYLSHDGSLTFSQKNIIKSHCEHLSLAEHNLKTVNLTAMQKKLFQQWQARESAYLCLIYLLKRDIKHAVTMLRYGLTRQPFYWLPQLISIMTKTITRKIYRYFSKSHSPAGNLSL